jgi:tagatose 1,6-diphosphate aldolase
MKSLERLATDQRRSLRLMIAKAAGVAEAGIPDARLEEFNSAVTASLSPFASATLIDPEFGRPAMARLAAGCALLATYESNGFENPRPHRMLALMREYSGIRLRDVGAQGIKVLLSWAPDDAPDANDEKRVLIERIGQSVRTCLIEKNRVKNRK